MIFGGLKQNMKDTDRNLSDDLDRNLSTDQD